MAMEIAKALADFQSYLAANFGGKIDLSLVREFSVMVRRIIDAIN